METEIRGPIFLFLFKILMAVERLHISCNRKRKLPAVDESVVDTMLESPAPTSDVQVEAAAKTKLRGRPAVRISLVKSDNTI